MDHNRKVHGFRRVGKVRFEHVRVTLQLNRRNAALLILDSFIGWMLVQRSSLGSRVKTAGLTGRKLRWSPPERNSYSA